MKEVKTYFVKRNGKYIWLSQFEKPLKTDTIVEERMLFIAENGKTLIDKNGSIVGTCLWNKDSQELTEIDIPVEEDTMTLCNIRHEEEEEEVEDKD